MNGQQIGLSRRGFIGSALATGVACAFGAASGRPRLCFGVMSDMHITDGASCAAVIRTLRHFRERDVDAVVFAGDMIDNGLLGELELFARAWFDVFPKGLGRDGRPVEMLSVLGNHDLQRWTKEWADEIKMPWDRVLREDLDRPGRLEAEWLRLFGRPLEPLWMKSVNGVRFVGSNYQYRSDRQRRTAPAGGEEMPAFLERNRATLEKDDVFFFVQHMHPKGTCSAPWAWGQDDGTATEILKTFPNAIALTGHSHTPLNDERTLWRGSFTSVGTAAIGFLIPFGGRENSEIDGLKDSGDQLLPRLRPSDGKHALVCRVETGRVVFERWDAQNGLPLAEDWVVPIPARADSFADRAARAAVPAFAAGAAIRTKTAEVCDRRGNRKRARIAVFPNACSPRAFDYEVQVEVTEADVCSVRRTKRVYSEGFYRAEKADVPEVSCPFAEEDFPAPNGGKPGEQPSGRRWRFVVRPCDSFGNRGSAIFTAWFDA